MSWGFYGRSRAIHCGTWTMEKVAIAHRLSASERSASSPAADIPQDLVDLTLGL